MDPEHREQRPEERDEQATFATVRLALVVLTVQVLFIVPIVRDVTDRAFNGYAKSQLLDDSASRTSDARSGSDEKWDLVGTSYSVGCMCMQHSISLLSDWVEQEKYS